MARPELRRRSQDPNPSFGAKFEAALQDFSASLLKSDAFKHALTKGEQRELPVQKFFRDHLPSRYKVTSGETIDSRDNHSPQLDVMIYDGDRNFAIYSETASILPAEALIASVEVKSELTKQETAKSLRAAQKLYKLRPFGEAPTKRKEGGAPATFRCRYFHSLFAYNTDLAAENWLQEEFSRTISIAAEERIDPNLIDRIYVANRGLLNIPHNHGLAETGDDGRALLNFYMHVLNFITRENKRRDPVDYIVYAGRMTKGWKLMQRN
jgi:hypothetical protein